MSTSKQENLPPEGGGDGGRNLPNEAEYTDEQLAIIKAAMLVCIL